MRGVTMRHAAGVGLIALVVTASGCAFTRGSGVEYKSARTVPQLELPPELSRPARDDRFQLPQSATQAESGSATLSTYQAERSAAPRPGSTEVLPDAGRMRILRSGNERWLVVPETPEKLWPLVREFWQDNGFLIKIDQPEIGVLETEWNENRARIPNDGIRSIIGKVFDSVYSTGERDKYRTRLERGLDGKSTEIFISHRGMVEMIVNQGSGSDNTRWQPRSADPELEAEFLRRMMVRLGLDETRARSTIAAATTDTSQRARISAASDGAQMLAVAEPFDRAWRRVGLALDRVGFTVEDRDRSQGVYFVRYVDPRTDQKVERGILSRFAFWRSDDPKPNPNEQYRVQVRDGVNDSSVVQVLNREGKVERNATSQRILTLLQEQLR